MLQAASKLVETVKIFSGNSASETISRETQTVSVFCDICSESATGTIEILQKRGWGIYQPLHEFCPFHEQMI